MRVYDDVDTSFGYSAEDVRFTYDGQGRRLTKTYTYDPGEDYSGDFCIGRDTAYTYDGDGRLIREYTTEYYTESASATRELIFLYDEDGVVGVTYSFNGATPVTYYYHKNLQGDVIAIYDEGGNLKAGYAYDAWGNHVVTNSNLPQLAQCNPFRYRGYYYDVETGLYYCNARYYSPLLRRWISPDAFSYLDPKTFCGIDLYCYCKNNPIMFIDPSGRIPLIWMFVIFIGCVAAGAVSYGVVFYRKGNRGWDLAKAVILGTFMGLAAAGLIISATAMFVVAATQSLSVCVFGFLTAKQVAAIGFLAYDFTAFIIAPLYGITMEGIEIGNTNSEYKPPEPKVVPPYLS